MLSTINTPSMSGEVPPILPRALKSQATYTECRSDNDAAGSDRRRDAPPPITPRETLPSPVESHAGHYGLQENKVTKLCATASVRSTSRSQAGAQISRERNLASLRIVDDPAVTEESPSSQDKIRQICPEHPNALISKKGELITISYAHNHARFIPFRTRCTQTS